MTRALVICAKYLGINLSEDMSGDIIMGFFWLCLW